MMMFAAIPTLVTLLAFTSGGYSVQPVMRGFGPVWIEMTGKITDVAPTEEQRSDGEWLTLRGPNDSIVYFGDVDLKLVGSSQPGISFFWKAFGPLQYQLYLAADEKILDELKSAAALGHHVDLEALFYRTGRLQVFGLTPATPEKGTTETEGT